MDCLSYLQMNYRRGYFASPSKFDEVLSRTVVWFAINTQNCLFTYSYGLDD